ncbi:MAG: UDP-N-acetylmuramoyl-L-alanine--D-glutamate ligase [Myxococcota bacterium]|jgi:UDP-N-acetylmuramoylalanine--D-glutamate ligase|nr:UDP-N-acetylmuramoyl-L-alanine--D-glutamate ligase [Myxococcota bacterium]
MQSKGELSGQRVLVMGLGIKDGGVGATLFAANRGASVTVTDLRGPEALADSLAELAPLELQLRLGGHDEEDFRNADLVIRNETIRRDNHFLRIAAAHGARIESPISLFMAEYDRPFLGVTGTKGKSFTTQLLQHLIAASGERAVAAGNNCVSPLRWLDASSTTLVLELSAQQLAEAAAHRRSPHIACWLNFFEDHLDSYASMAAYHADKAVIARFQSTSDVLVLPFGKPTFAQLDSPAQRRYFALSEPPGVDGVFLADGAITLVVDGRRTAVLPLRELPPTLRVPHHLELALAAVACAHAHGVSPTAIATGLKSFPGLPHRFEHVASSRGISFINDSAASTPESVELALRAIAADEGHALSFAGPIALIVGGGGDKKLCYTQLAQSICERVAQLILFEDDPIAALLRPLLADFRGPISTVRCMREAVAEGRRALETSGGGTLLLSPGCCGWPRFPDMFVRGRVFCEAVREGLTLTQGTP